jgi:hypothetical protein
MKIIEPKKEIYMMLPIDGVAGENCTIMVQLMYLATWKEYTSKLYKFRSVRRNLHTRSRSTEF